MAKATVSEREIAPARPAVIEKTITLTLTEAEAAGLAALTGRAACQEDHPNSLYKVYRVLGNVVSYDKRPRVVVKGEPEAGCSSIRFAD